MIELRPVRDDDKAFLYRVYASTRIDELQPLDWDEQAKRDFLTMQFRAQRAHYRAHYPSADFQLVLRDHEPIGRLYVERRSDEIRVIDIALLPEFRNDGIGTSLLESLLLEARGRGIPLRIHVEKTNPAMRLYSRLGFRAIEDNSVYVLLECRAA